MIFLKSEKMKKPTKILSDEHKNILKFIDILDKKCDDAEECKGIDKEFFKKAIEFIRNYADKFHHAKEEDILFKELCSDEVELHCNPVEQMLHEHELGRGFVKGMEAALNKDDKEKIIENARGYIQLLQEHIFKEDNILYPMADSALSEKVQKLILEKFEKREKQFNDMKKYLNILKR